MFRRIGTVIWWVGAALAALALVVAGLGYYEHRNCAQIMATHAENQAASEKAAASYKRAPPVGNSITADWDAVVVKIDTANESPEMQNSVESCKQYSFPAGTLTIFGILVLGLWSLAFVFGGSFWKPPAVK